MLFRGAHSHSLSRPNSQASGGKPDGLSYSKAASCDRFDSTTMFTWRPGAANVSWFMSWSKNQHSSKTLGRYW